MGDDKIRRHFYDFIAREMVLDGDVFVGTDSAEERTKHVNFLMAKRGMFRVNHKYLKSDLFFGPGAERSRYHGYLEKFATFREKNFANAFIADISQSPVARGRCGTLVPSCTRSGFLMSFSKDKPLTPNEVDFAMAWPTAQLPGCEEFQKCMATDMEGLSSQARRSLSGNGMNLFQFSCWFTYVISHMLLRDDLQKFNPLELRLMAQEESEEESEDGPEVVEGDLSHGGASSSEHRPPRKRGTHRRGKGTMKKAMKDHFGAVGSSLVLLESDSKRQKL